MLAEVFLNFFNTSVIMTAAPSSVVGWTVISNILPQIGGAASWRFPRDMGNHQGGP
jgi:hypothetical protein